MLVRNLLRAAASRVERIEFFGDGAVSDEGWDGRLACAADSPFVPDSASGWEVGSEQPATAKAGRGC